MKNIAMVTVHRTLNYGTMLQTYACKSLFHEYGCETTLVDYYREKDYRFDDFENFMAYYSARKRMIAGSGFVSSLKLLGKAFFSYRVTKRFFMMCNSFLKDNVTISIPYYSFNDLNEDPPVADYYCAGSDQIWNSDYNGGIDPVYYLDFTKKGQKISFCSSIGKTILSEKEQNDMREKLTSFKVISVREKSAQELLSALGIDATDLIDPTLVEDSAFWDSMCSKPILEKPYLLLYKLRADDTIDQIATKIAKEKGLNIVRIAFDQIRKKRGETTIVLPAISEFLSLIKNADYVVTNSFHGTCFSINFHKQFLAVPRKSYNVRIKNILDKLGISDRLFDDNIDVKNYCKKIDYSLVRDNLETERNKAKNWLKTVLSDN